jgi:hypothetical protein
MASPIGSRIMARGQRAEVRIGFMEVFYPIRPRAEKGSIKAA